MTSSETKAKISAAKKGVQKSFETRKKMSDAQRSRVKSWSQSGESRAKRLASRQRLEYSAEYLEWYLNHQKSMKRLKEEREKRRIVRALKEKYSFRLKRGRGRPRVEEREELHRLKREREELFQKELSAALRPRIRVM